MSEAATPDQGGLPWRAACGMAALVLTLSVMALAQSNHREDDPTANQVLSGSAFGYADAPGRQVLVPVEPALARGMKQFRKAVAAPGRVVDLTYAGAQRAGDGGAAGQGAGRFAGMAGAVFSASAPVGSGGDVLVATDAFLADRQVLAVTPLPRTDCAPGLRQSLAVRAGRRVAWCKDVASVADGGVLSLAGFEDRDGNGGLTLAYDAPGGTVLLDYPANGGPDGPWAVDGGRSCSVDSFQPLFAFRTVDGLELAVRWSEEDGDAMELYRQQDDRFVPFVAATLSRGE